MIFGHMPILQTFTSQMLLLKMVFSFRGRPRYDFWPHADSADLYQPNATFEKWFTAREAGQDMSFGHMPILQTFTRQMLLLKMVYSSRGRPRHDFWPHADSADLYQPNATLKMV